MWKELVYWGPHMFWTLCSVELKNLSLKNPCVTDKQHRAQSILCKTRTLSELSGFKVLALSTIFPGIWEPAWTFICMTWKKNSQYKNKTSTLGDQSGWRDEGKSLRREELLQISQKILNERRRKAIYLDFGHPLW
jgi:hypothetical protein